MVHKAAALWIVCILLASCALPSREPSTQSPGGSPSPQITAASATLTPAPPETAGQPEAAGATPAGTTTAPAPAAPPVNYTLTVTFNYGFRRLNVIETVEYTNQTGESLPSIPLTVEPNRQAGVFRLNQIILEDGSPAEYTLDGRTLDVRLPQPLEPGQTASFTIAYDLFPPVIVDADDENDRPYAFGYTERQVNLVDWYAMVPPYLPGSGWMIHNPWYYGEHVSYEMSNFDVTIRLEEPPENLVIAASAPAESIEGGYHYTFDNARSFAWSAGAEYQVLTETVGDVTVSSYYFPFNPEAGERILRDTADALELYSRLFGAYPHKTLAVVEADFLDGMEYDGLYFLSRGFYNLYEGTPKGYLTAIGVHETAHQWWYGRVGNDQALEPWIDEAFCTYSEYLFYENVYPDLTDWWWSFRVDFYAPTGFINGRIYDYNGYRPYVNAVYFRGAYFLHHLRGIMGDEDFFQFIQDYFMMYTGRIVTRTDFFALLQLYTDQDVTSLVNEYFHAP